MKRSIKKSYNIISVEMCKLSDSLNIPVSQAEKRFDNNKDFMAYWRNEKKNWDRIMVKFYDPKKDKKFSSMIDNILLYGKPGVPTVFNRGDYK